MTINVMTIIVLLILALLFIRGYKRGFLGIIFGIIAWILMIVFMQWATPQAYEHLKQDEAFVEDVSSHVEEVLTEKASEITLDNASEELSEEKVSSISSLLPEGTMEQYNELMEGINQYQSLTSNVTDESLKAQITEQANSVLDQKKAEFVAEATSVITDYVLRGIATLISFIIAVIACSLIWLIIGILNRTPVIGTASHLAGGIFGIFEGLLLVWIIMYIISLSSMTEIGSAAYEQIQDNQFLLYIYDNNILMNFIK